MKQTDPQMKIRLPEPLKAQVESAAKTNNRSMNAEIVARLEASFAPEAASAATAAIAKLLHAQEERLKYWVQESLNQKEK